MLTFNQYEKDVLLAHLKDHEGNDAFKRGAYWKSRDVDFRGSIGECTVSNYSDSGAIYLRYEQLFGIPRGLAKLEEAIFSYLPDKDAKSWPSKFITAIPVETDLSDVLQQFTRWLMLDPEYGALGFAETNSFRAIIKKCADPIKYCPSILGGDLMCLTAAAYNSAIKASLASVEIYFSSSAALRDSQCGFIQGVINAVVRALRAAAASYDAAVRAGDVGAHEAARAADAAAFMASFAVMDVLWIENRGDHYQRMADMLIGLLEMAYVSNDGEKT